MMKLPITSTNSRTINPQKNKEPESFRFKSAHLLPFPILMNFKILFFKIFPKDEFSRFSNENSCARASSVFSFHPANWDGWGRFEKRNRAATSSFSHQSLIRSRSPENSKVFLPFEAKFIREKVNQKCEILKAFKFLKSLSDNVQDVNLATVSRSASTSSRMFLEHFFSSSSSTLTVSKSTEDVLQVVD